MIHQITAKFVKENQQNSKKLKKKMKKLKNKLKCKKCGYKIKDSKIFDNTIRVDEKTAKAICPMCNNDTFDRLYKFDFSNILKKFKGDMKID